LIGSLWAALLFLGVVHALVAAQCFALLLGHELIRHAWALAHPLEGQGTTLG
jgi:hypothetical protein